MWKLTKNDQIKAKHVKSIQIQQYILHIKMGKWKCFWIVRGLFDLKDTRKIKNKMQRVTCAVVLKSTGVGIKYMYKLICIGSLLNVKSPINN